MKYNKLVRDRIPNILDAKGKSYSVRQCDEGEKLEYLKRKLIEEGLNYPEDSAGRLMQRKFIAVDNSWNVGNAIDYLRNETENLPEDFYDVYLVDKADIMVKRIIIMPYMNTILILINGQI